MSGYDWYAAEGRPEHLRPMNDAIGRLFDEPSLREAEVYVFSGGIDWQAERAQIEVATPDAARARLAIERLFPFPFDLEVVAPAEYVEQAIEWESWTHGRARTEIVLWSLDPDIAAAEHTVAEDDERVTITLRGLVYQGATAMVGVVTQHPVTLARPVGDRAVVDGAAGSRRPSRRPL